MKRIISLFVFLVLIVGLVGCSNSTTTDNVLSKNKEITVNFNKITELQFYTNNKLFTLPCDLNNYMKAGKYDKCKYLENEHDSLFAKIKCYRIDKGKKTYDSAVLLIKKDYSKVIELSSDYSTITIYGIEVKNESSVLFPGDISYGDNIDVNNLHKKLGKKPTELISSEDNSFSRATFNKNNTYVYEIVASNKQVSELRLINSKEVITPEK